MATSPSSRRAWIEIVLRPESELTLGVALLAEGVDRNFLAQCLLEPVDVALLAEGVDRNAQYAKASSPKPLSPSSRRAWIEIP